MNLRYLSSIAELRVPWVSFSCDINTIDVNGIDMGKYFPRLAGCQALVVSLKRVRKEEIYQLCSPDEL